MKCAVKSKQGKGTDGRPEVVVILGGRSGKAHSPELAFEWRLGRGEGVTGRHRGQPTTQTTLNVPPLLAALSFTYTELIQHVGTDVGRRDFNSLSGIWVSESAKLWQ